MKKTLAIASLVFVAASLSGCGGDSSNTSSSSSSTSSSEPSTPATSSASSSGYCDQLTTFQNDFQSLDFTSLTDVQFSDVRSAIDDLESSAPDDVKPDWTTLGDSLGELQNILDKFGVSLDVLKEIQADPTNLPDGLTVKKVQQLGGELQSYSQSVQGDVSKAGEDIQTNAKSECGIDLGGSPSGAPSS